MLYVPAMKHCIIIFLIFLLPSLSSAQNTLLPAKYTLSGYIKDSLTGETLIGATLTVAGKSKGISSNQYGFYSITLDQGEYTFIVSYIGYLSKIMQVNLQNNQLYNFDLLHRSTLQQEVIVSSKKRDANVRNAQMGKFTLPIEQIRTIPAFLGEVDLLKTIHINNLKKMLTNSPFRGLGGLNF